MLGEAPHRSIHTGWLRDRGKWGALLPSANEVCYTSLSVILFTGAGLCPRGGVSQHTLGRPPPGRHPHPIPPGRHPPPPAGHCSGRYAAYWNVFLYYTECFTLRMNREGQGQVLGGTGYRLISRIRSCKSWSVSMGFSCERFLLDIGPGSAPKLSSVITSFGTLF